MKKLICLALLAISTLTPAAAKEYIDGSKPFILITPAIKQAEAWAVCSASYTVTAAVMTKLSQPAQAKQMKELANGAKLAVGISLVMAAIDTPERFNAAWAYSKIAMDEWPGTMQATMMADAERLGEAGFDEFVSDIGATNTICIDNLEGQQAYIDMWRELAMSGLIKLPENNE